MDLTNDNEGHFFCTNPSEMTGPVEETMIANFAHQLGYPSTHNDDTSEDYFAQNLTNPQVTLTFGRPIRYTRCIRPKNSDRPKQFFCQTSLMKAFNYISVIID